MINQEAYGLFPGDPAGTFYRLKNLSMGSMLDTVEALMKNKNFMPNPNLWSSQLEGAGIGRTRIELALEAVLAKAARHQTFTSFSAERLRRLLMILPAERSVIAAYLSPGATGVIPDETIIAVYLDYARSAVARTRYKLGGPGNKWFDGGPSSVVNKLQAMYYGRGLDGTEITKIAAAAERAGGGNCDEFSAYAFEYLRKNLLASPIGWFKLSSGDHAFVLIGEAAFKDQIGDADVKVWGKRVAVCDAWANDYYAAIEIPTRLPGTDGTFSAVKYAQA